MIPAILEEKYDVQGLIGRGAFSQVYQAVYRPTNTLIALKVTELEECPVHSVESQVLALKSPPPGVPKLVEHEVIDDSSFTALQLLGTSFYSMMQEQRTPLALELVVKGLYDVLKILKWLHKKGYVHRDVKPDNMLISRDQSSHQIFLIDYSEARKYRFQSEFDSMVGNPNFISLNVLKGGVEGPKDDLESLLCSVVYLLTGSLPWMGAVEMDPVRLKKIVVEQKEAMTPEKLCRKLPQEIQKLMEYVRSISGTDLPEYSRMFELVKSLAKRTRVHLKSHASLKVQHKYKRNSFCVAPPSPPDATLRSSSLHHSQKLSPGVLSKLPTSLKRISSAPSVELTVNKEEIPTVVSSKLPSLTSRLLQELLKRRMRVKH